MKNFTFEIAFTPKERLAQLAGDRLSPSFLEHGFEVWVVVGAFSASMVILRCLY